MRASDFFSVKAVPKLFWSAPYPLTIRPPLLSVVVLCFGLVIFGLGEALLIAAGMGVSPWTVFAQGVSLAAGWSVGTSTFLISIAVLIFWIPLRQIPGIGTVLNAIIIALVIDLALPYLPRPDIMAAQVALTVLGVGFIGFGSSVYLVSNLGPGARDGLMTGLQRRTGYPIMWVRIALEVLVVCIGWSLGGTVGFGTILFALAIGPCISVTLHIFKLLFAR